MDTISAGGAALTLNSIDLARLIAGAMGYVYRHVHWDPDEFGHCVPDVPVNDWANTLQTFAFSGFTNVVSVSSLQGTNIGFFGPQETAYQSIMGW